jgi:hypothetical protein
MFVFISPEISPGISYGIIEGTLWDIWIIDRRHVDHGQGMMLAYQK